MSSALMDALSTLHEKDNSNSTAAAVAPAQVPVPGVLFAEVVCGGMHTVALSTTGEIWTWGVNDEGALGRKTFGACLQGRGGVAAVLGCAFVFALLVWLP
eukprot:1161713-Pelagomonas_calceolata.AAC.4